MPHYEFAKYVHDYWKHFGLESITTLNTRVEKAEKKEDGSWELRLRQQEATEDGSRVLESTWTDVRTIPRLRCVVLMSAFRRGPRCDRTLQCASHPGHSGQLGVV